MSTMASVGGYCTQLFACDKDNFCLASDKHVSTFVRKNREKWLLIRRGVNTTFCSQN